jgi:23S rRNA G2445 N2-methylase RlmL
LFRTVVGLERIASQEMCEKLGVAKLNFSPYGRAGWIKCEIEEPSLKNVGTLRSITEACVILNEENYDKSFSLDHFADIAVETVPVFAPQPRSVSVSAYSFYSRPNQREIQGAFSKRIRGRLGAQCNLRDYDIALKVTLLKNVAIAAIDLEVQPGNLPKKIITHATPLLPPIAYCMIRLASPKEGERLLDPMCGCGTIPLIASLEWSKLRVTGSDIVGDNIECARRNAATLDVMDRIEFLVSDVRDLADTGIHADIIVVNPPYGISVPSPSDVEELYMALFDASHEILLDGGRIVTITPYREIVEKATSIIAYETVSVHEVREGQPPRIIHVIRKPL